MSSSSFTSSSYSFSSSSSSSNVNGEQTSTGYRTMQQTNTDADGNRTVQSATQNLGQPVVQETRQYDAQGREMLTGSGGDGARGRIEDVSDSKDADAQYEERMEDEYAKREGGA